MRFITEESLKRPEVLRWHERIKERYTPPKNIKLTVILPCSAKKPYSKSKSHMQFQKYIRRGAGKKIGLVHEIILTSPLGLVPRELEEVYPASHYDIPVTGHWSKNERAVALELLRDYISKSSAEVVGHVDGACREICSDVGVELTEENILSNTSLRDLERVVSEKLDKCKPVRRDGISNLRRVCDFQFGKGSSRYLLPAGTSTKGRQIFLKNEQIAAVNPNDGLLALSLEGGRLLKKHIVKISFKLETNSIFCVGVEKAGREIRPNDEVVVIYRNKVVGVGKAVLNGEEMTKARKGLAVSLRHRLK
ncbi:MAG: DUF5591 domain-containing protein [Candidatus Hydrothermarchaeaceae archaeon]